MLYRYNTKISYLPYIIPKIEMRLPAYNYQNIMIDLFLSENRIV